MKKLIINADDFGRHELINRAVEKAFREGCLKSATIMAGGKFFDDAVTVIKNNPELGVGIHFTLANGFPILPAEKIPTLINDSGVFHENYVVFLKKYLQARRNKIRTCRAIRKSFTRRNKINSLRQPSTFTSCAGNN